MEFTKKTMIVALLAVTLKAAAGAGGVAGAPPVVAPLVLPAAPPALDPLSPRTFNYATELLDEKHRQDREDLETRQEDILNAQDVRVAEARRRAADQRAELAARRADVDAQRIRQVEVSRAQRQGLYDRFAEDLLAGLPAIDDLPAGGIAPAVALPRGAALRADLQRRNTDAALFEQQLAAEQDAARERDDRTTDTEFLALVAQMEDQLVVMLQDIAMRLEREQATYDRTSDNYAYRQQLYRANAAREAADEAARLAREGRVARHDPRARRAADELARLVAARPAAPVGGAAPGGVAGAAPVGGAAPGH